ncbi:uncharacterized protein LOC110980999 [Acanthaster planci]|uniref:Uncharacterized protein LOC110980999 n=1 Tax=Acanthaster planci TaxID=133434 RepID=A0A8B7YMY3_ACAPL|nr:uncharacterized protein LOC110980999 [Acanthaster planci]
MYRFRQLMNYTPTKSCRPALYAKEPQTLMPPAQSKSPRGIASSASLAKGSRSAGPGKGSAQRSGSAPASKSVSPGSLGFKPSGVAKGSAAATMMSSQGNVKSGSVLADLQSSGAGGRTPSKGSTAVCNTRPSRGGTSQTIECTKQ